MYLFDEIISTTWFETDKMHNKVGCVGTIIGLVLITIGLSKIHSGSIIIGFLLIIMGFLMFVFSAAAAATESFNKAVYEIISLRKMHKVVGYVGIIVGLLLIGNGLLEVRSGLSETNIEGRTIMIGSIRIIIGFLMFVFFGVAVAVTESFSEAVEAVGGGIFLFLLILPLILGGLLACYELFQYLRDGDRSVYSALEGIEWALEIPVTWIGLREILFKFPLWLFLLLVVPVCPIIVIGIPLTIIYGFRCMFLPEK